MTRWESEVLFGSSSSTEHKEKEVKNFCKAWQRCVQCNGRHLPEGRKWRNLSWFLARLSAIFPTILRIWTHPSGGEMLFVFSLNPSNCMLHRINILVSHRSTFTLDIDKMEIVSCRSVDQWFLKRRNAVELFVAGTLDPPDDKSDHLSRDYMVWNKLAGQLSSKWLKCA